MKNLKHSVLGIIAVTFVTVGLFSCSNDEVNDLQQNNFKPESNLNSAKSMSDPEDTDFEYELDQRYSNFDLGRRVVIVDEEDNYFALKEAIINDELTAYVFFDLQANSITSLLEINKEDLKMNIEDFVEGQILLYEDINTIEGFLDYDYDLIEIGSNYQTNGIPILGGDRFWGWACSMEYNNGGECYVDCSYNVLGTRTTPNDRLSRPCNQKPNSYKNKYEMTPIGFEPWIEE